MNCDILKKINDGLLELGDDCEWVKAPAFQAEYASLKGKRLIFIDDVAMVIANFLPELMVATDGNFIPMHFSGEPMSVLVEKILSRNADVILMDYSLSDTVKGDVIIAKLRASGFTGFIIGFSSSDKSDKFEKAGANTSIRKMNGVVGEVVLNIAKFLTN